MARTEKKPDPTTNRFREAAICDCGSHGFVGLTKAGCALFDPEDLALVAGRLWIKTGSGYACRTETVGGKRRTVSMHNVVLNDCAGIPDHHNRDKCDNRKSNLRVTDKCGNAQNSKHVYGELRLKGVGINKNGSYRARISCGGRQVNIGWFRCPVMAAEAYDRAAREFHGEFALTNESLGLINDWRQQHGNQKRLPLPQDNQVRRPGRN